MNESTENDTATGSVDSPEHEDFRVVGEDPFSDAVDSQLQEVRQHTAANVVQESQTPGVAGPNSALIDLSATNANVFEITAQQASTATNPTNANVFEITAQQASTATNPETDSDDDRFVDAPLTRNVPAGYNTNPMRFEDNVDNVERHSFTPMARGVPPLVDIGMPDDIPDIFWDNDVDDFVFIGTRTREVADSIPFGISPGSAGSGSSPVDNNGAPSESSADMSSQISGSRLHPVRQSLAHSMRQLGNAMALDLEDQPETSSGANGIENEIACQRQEEYDEDEENYVDVERDDEGEVGKLNAEEEGDESSEEMFVSPKEDDEFEEDQGDEAPASHEKLDAEANADVSDVIEKIKKCNVSEDSNDNSENSPGGGVFKPYSSDVQANDVGQVEQARNDNETTQTSSIEYESASSNESLNQRMEADHSTSTVDALKKVLEEIIPAPINSGHSGEDGEAIRTPPPSFHSEATEDGSASSEKMIDDIKDEDDDADYIAEAEFDFESVSPACPEMVIAANERTDADADALLQRVISGEPDDCLKQSEHSFKLMGGVGTGPDATNRHGRNGENKKGHDPAITEGVDVSLHNLCEAHRGSNTTEVDVLNEAEENVDDGAPVQREGEKLEECLDDHRVMNDASRAETEGLENTVTNIRSTPHDEDLDIKKDAILQLSTTDEETAKLDPKEENLETLMNGELQPTLSGEKYLKSTQNNDNLENTVNVKSQISITEEKCENPETKECGEDQIRRGEKCVVNEQKPSNKSSAAVKVSSNNESNQRNDEHAKEANAMQDVDGRVESDHETNLKDSASVNQTNVALNSMSSNSDKSLRDQVVHDSSVNFEKAEVNKAVMSGTSSECQDIPSSQCKTHSLIGSNLEASRIILEATDLWMAKDEIGQEVGETNSLRGRSTADDAARLPVGDSVRTIPFQGNNRPRLSSPKSPNRKGANSQERTNTALSQAQVHETLGRSKGNTTRPTRPGSTKFRRALGSLKKELPSTGCREVKQSSSSQEKVRPLSEVKPRRDKDALGSKSSSVTEVPKYVINHVVNQLPNRMVGDGTSSDDNSITRCPARRCTPIGSDDVLTQPPGDNGASRLSRISDTNENKANLLRPQLSSGRQFPRSSAPGHDNSSTTVTSILSNMSTSFRDERFKKRRASALCPAYPRNPPEDKEFATQLQRSKIEPFKRYVPKKHLKPAGTSAEEYHRYKMDLRMSENLLKIRPSVDCHIDPRFVKRRSSKEREGFGARKPTDGSLLTMENVKFLEVLKYGKVGYCRDDIKGYKSATVTSRYHLRGKPLDKSQSNKTGCRQPSYNKGTQPGHSSKVRLNRKGEEVFSYKFTKTTV